MALLKIKKLEKFKLNDSNFAYLIMRTYPKLKLTEYLVCINYNFKNNFYSEGISFNENRLSLAYKVYNNLVIFKSFDFLKKEESFNTISDEEIDGES